VCVWGGGLHAKCVYPEVPHFVGACSFPFDLTRYQVFALSSLLLLLLLLPVGMHTTASRSPAPPGSNFADAFK